MNHPSLFGKAIDAFAGGERITLTGLWGSSKALFLWELAQSVSRPILVVAPTQKEAHALYSDALFFASGSGEGASVAYFPPYDVMPYDVMAPDPAVVAERLGALRAMACGDARLVVTPVRSYLKRLVPPDAVVGGDLSVTAQKGAEVGYDFFVGRLNELGYTRAAMVNDPGEYSVRGGIVDFFVPGYGLPVRVEFFGDTVESIREFNPDTQRSQSGLEEIRLAPAREGGAHGKALDEGIRRLRAEASTEGFPLNRLEGVIEAIRERGVMPDSLAPFFYPVMADLAGYFNAPPLIVVDEPERAAHESREFEKRVFSSFSEARAESCCPRPETLYITSEEFESGRVSGAEFLLVSAPITPAPGDKGVFHYETRSVEGMRLRDIPPAEWPEDMPKTPLAVFLANLKRLIPGRAVNVVCANAGQADRLREIFAEYGLPAKLAPPEYQPSGGGSPASLTVGELSAGFLMDEPSVAFITFREIFGEKQRRAPAPKAKVERFLTSLSELSVGDYVVHIDHGIGRYLGLKRLKLMGVESDFLEVTYQGSDKLYVPMDELGRLQKYSGADGAEGRLDKLGGAGWEKTKAKAKKAAREIAGELLELYAARSVAEGHAYTAEDHLYREMESSFEYEETPDQAKAIDEVKADMEATRPMDRLVCGDVGFGKTEVAVRAAFKAAQDGKQVAVLAPTTLLVSQHLETFTSRLAAFPVRVEGLSRFTPKDKVKEILAGMKDGRVDIVIGTHRLLQKDVAFHDLGLLVIDEEHRFGVTHKEKLKSFKKQVDSLTLTATPIPRTLQMSISGIRDLSVIETPPPDRLPIKTVVTRFDKSVIREAVMREFDRGGQVFFVHNRIDSIYAIAELLTGLVPEAKIAVAHGRLREDALDRVMSAFIDGESNLLLTTSIIESGLDIPSANTIIVNRADRFGLADLYQLRGRVGRSRVRAYAYLMVPGEDGLSEAARKRLRVLSELTELGVGFRLALHDLEIRGSGNILGAAQSGHIEAVGFELYTQLLEEAVKELKGEPVVEAVEPALDLKVSAYIPEGYVSDTAHRLGAYKRLAGAASLEELSDTKAELVDRYGPLPEPAKRLIEVMELKVMARSVRAAGIALLPAEVKITFSDKVEITPDRLIGFLKARKGSARYVPRYSLYVKRPRGGWDEVYTELKNILKELA